LFDIENIDLRCSDGVVIFGKMNFEPNVQSVFWFANHVLEKLPPHIKLYVIGTEPSSRLFRLAHLNPRIEIMGFIENPYPLIKGAIANISPIQMGGGIQNKVIEGLAIGALGLLSPLAARPMKNIEASGLIVCKTPEDWVNIIIRASKNPEFYGKNRLVGREYARANFSWEAYCRDIKSGIIKALESIPEGNSNG
jgi:glycosyltransferase involved in cell wall biosynthesis